MNEFELIRVLKGHSGCKVILCKSSSGYFVRKSSEDQGYLVRFRNQIGKQIALSEIIPLPKVLDVCDGESELSYTMEFIQGEDFHTACLARPPMWINGFVNHLFDFFLKLRAQGQKEDLSSFFVAKLQSIGNTLEEKPMLESVRGRILPLIDKLKTVDYGSVPATLCHGDMTLENIIFQADGAFMFIDVLDGDPSSIWLDVAKLCFDLEVGWTLRETLWSETNVERRALSMLSQYALEEVGLMIEAHFRDILPVLPALKAFQALRILPYAHDLSVIGRLSRFIEETVN